MTFSCLQYYVFILSLDIFLKTVMVLLYPRLHSAYSVVATLEVFEDQRVDKVGRVEGKRKGGVVSAPVCFGVHTCHNPEI